ncbi:glycosyl transferase family 2 [halophilic archaeon]|nr:glycosyl transferase family 2 [halophilic archaeon]
MEYVQERVTTLHDLTGDVPDAPTGDAAVVVPMTDRECRARAAERVLAELEAVGPGAVVVPLRAPPGRVAAFREWLASFDLPLELLWCNGPRTGDLLARHGLDGATGKGRDVWLALGVAAERADYVVVHDADAKTYDASWVPRLLAPLAGEFSFTKGYYARVEDDRVYGRLFRLFYEPLVAALTERHDAAVLEYLAAFRYALAGEFGLTADLARSLRVEREWGLEVGTLGDAFARAGFAGTAQVDLGRYEHDHRGVAGPDGLSAMSEGVADALFRVCEAEGVEPDYRSLARRYRETADRFVRQYAADAAHNGLTYDPAAEREQVATYADAVAPPDDAGVLPAWSDAGLTPGAVLDAARPRVPQRLSD